MSSPYCFSPNNNGSLLQNKQKSKEIDKSIKKDKHTPTILKLLLLGASDSGKSTLFKHMKVLQENGHFTNQELHQYKQLVYQNIVCQMNLVLDLLFDYNQERLGITSTESSSTTTINFQDPDNFERTMRTRHAMQLINQGGIISSWPSIMKDIESLLNSNEIIEFLQIKKLYFEVNDSIYFLTRERFRYYTEDNYKPSIEDILRVRLKTTSIIEADFYFRGLNFKMVDVGGQKGLRKKWIHCFENVTAVLFVTSLNSYDQVLEEDGETNRLKDSLEIFKDISNTEYLKNSVLILFLNKADLFKKKIKSVPLKKYWPGFNYTPPQIQDSSKSSAATSSSSSQGGKSSKSTGETKAALNFISKMFTDLVDDKSRKVYIHPTCAVNTKNVKMVFENIIDNFLKKSLDQF
eukprot:gene8488-10432_t